MSQVAAVLVQARGDAIDYTPVSAVTVGQVVEIGSIPMVATHAIAAGELGSLACEGVFDLPKTSDVFSAGDAVYWNSAGDPVSGTAGTGAADGATGNLAGVATADAATGDSYVRTKLTAAKRTTTLGGSVVADDITGNDSSLAVLGKAGAGGGAGGAVPIAGGAGHTNGAGGAAGITGGAGAGTGAGGAVNATGGASGTGATGNGGAATVVGGAALSTNGSGGAASVTGGVATGTGTGGAVGITGGASAGASGTAGSVNINAGAANSGTPGSVNLAPSNGTVKVGPGAEQAAMKAINVSGTVAVTVPSITDPDCAKVDVDISAMTFAAAVGDAVIAIPLEALPSNCRLGGAWVSATDTVTITFSSEGGNVTGAAKNFKFLLIDLT